MLVNSDPLTEPRTLLGMGRYFTSAGGPPRGEPREGAQRARRGAREAGRGVRAEARGAAERPPFFFLTIRNGSVRYENASSLR